MANMVRNMNKVIHYCWFGKGDLPELARKCIASWKKYCPEYEIREWNEDNFDVESCKYVKEAYEQKKWAFVSDYARFKILHEYGGVYFDTDVELIKEIDDILERGPFMGFEFNGDKLGVAPGLGMSAEPKMDIYREIIEDYEKSSFLNDGVINYKTVVDRTTDILVNAGLEKKNSFQVVKGICVYPKEYFCPMDYNTGEIYLTENTRSIHWYDASWLDTRMKRRREVCLKIRKKFKCRFGELICNMYLKLSYFFELVSTGQKKEIVRKVKIILRKWKMAVQNMTNRTGRSK